MKLSDKIIVVSLSDMLRTMLNISRNRPAIMRPFPQDFFRVDLASHFTRVPTILNVRSKANLNFNDDQGDITDIFSGESFCDLAIDQAIESQVKNASYQEIVQMIRIMSDRVLTENCENWKQTSLGKTEAGQEIFKILRTECIDRLKFGHKDRIELNSQRFHEVLDFCLLWSIVDRDMTSSGFNYHVINKLGSTNHNYSMRRFKHFTIEGFVNFCVLMGTVNLQSDFHKYYCTVKFVDLLPSMNQTEIAQVCVSLVKKDICHGHTHPMNTQLYGMMIQFISDNRGKISSENLIKMGSFLSLALPASLIPKMISLQQTMFEENLISNLNLKAMLALAVPSSKCLMYTRTNLSIDYWDKIISYMLNAKQDSLEEMISRDIASICQIVATLRDTPHGRAVVIRLIPIVKDRLLAGHGHRSAIMFILHMAHLELYDRDLLRALFDSPLVTMQKEDGRRAMSNTLKYGLKKGAERNIHLGGALLQLQGMVELECSDFNGAMITEDLPECFYLHAHSDTPLEVRNAGREKEELLNKVWVSRGLELHDILCEVLGGEENVWETYVMPFTGIIGYVIRVGGGQIEESVREQGLFDVKNIGQEERGGWIVFYMMKQAGNHVLRCGGKIVVNRLLEKIGYKGMCINMDEWNAMDCSSKKRWLTEVIDCKFERR